MPICLTTATYTEKFWNIFFQTFQAGMLFFRVVVDTNNVNEARAHIHPLNGSPPVDAFIAQ